MFAPLIGSRIYTTLIKEAILNKARCKSDKRNSKQIKNPSLKLLLSLFYLYSRIMTTTTAKEDQEEEKIGERRRVANDEQIVWLDCNAIKWIQYSTIKQDPTQFTWENEN